MKRKILCFVIAAAMTAAMGTKTSAEEFQGKRSWTVEFDGEAVESNLQSSELTEQIYQIQPGDSIELQVAIGNSGGSETDWYMTNEVLQSLEDSQSVAEGGAYGYELSYVGPDGTETVIYSSASVGGETDAGEEGLHQATGSLEDYFYLDRLADGEKGQVLLRVQLDGETQGNDYQDTLARLQMNFAVEKVEPNMVTEQGEDTVVNRVVRKIVTTTPRTGDPTQMLGLCAAAFVSGTALLILAVGTMKNRRRNRKGDQRS